MSIFTLVILAFAMSMDAFAAAVARGAGFGVRPGVKELLKIALTFGVVETIMPLLGWLGGSMAQSMIAEWDHWIAFVLLTGLGGKMIYEGIWGEDDDEDDAAAKPKSGWLLNVTTAIATSIDSAVVGVGLAFLETNIMVTALAIGTATTTMSFIGLYLGRRLGEKIGSRAEIAGGLVLLAIGTYILADHLGWLA